MVRALLTLQTAVSFLFFVGLVITLWFTLEEMTWQVVGGCALGAMLIWLKLRHYVYRVKEKRRRYKEDTSEESLD